MPRGPTKPDEGRGGAGTRRLPSRISAVKACGQQAPRGKRTLHGWSHAADRDVWASAAQRFMIHDPCICRAPAAWTVSSACIRAALSGTPLRLTASRSLHPAIASTVCDSAFALRVEVECLSAANLRMSRPQRRDSTFRCFPGLWVGRPGTCPRRRPRPRLSRRPRRRATTAFTWLLAGVSNRRYGWGAPRAGWGKAAAAPVPGPTVGNDAGQPRQRNLLGLLGGPPVVSAI